MSIILKGIDLPNKGETVTIEINSSGYVRAYSTVPMVCDHDTQAIQIPKNHGRLIDADALKEQCTPPSYCVWMNEIEEAPTILEREENK